MDFYRDQTDEVQRKIEWTLNLLRTIDRVPKKYFDHLTGTDGLFEVRIELGGNIFSPDSNRDRLFRQGKLSGFGERFSEENAKNSKDRNRKSIKDKSRI